ncbi:MAG: HsdR family type I site-specific deoxyribonuclease [Chloroflexi bacterium]|nr:HsdR family type I site-specific deoxyribonuclease [Chloroflexota bacterium]
MKSKPEANRKLKPKSNANSKNRLEKNSASESKANQGYSSLQRLMEDRRNERQPRFRSSPGIGTLALAVEALTRDRSAMSLVQANREIYGALKEGLKVAYRDEENEEQVATVRLIDWQTPANNDFLLVSQLWVAGDIYTRRADLVGFVNGLPLLFVELKASHRRLVNAFRGNFHDYQQTIPHLFWYNGLVILSNGRESRVGSISTEWEHFGEWKRINDEGETGVISLETTLRATCPPARLLDLVENFTLFAETKGGVKKLLAKNHQYLGVNRAIEEVKKLQENQGKLGVFWHTQGSGKSYSMIFFAQKVLRTLPGNWTFLVVTDRQELDKQIYQTFARAEVVTEPEKSVRAQSGEHLRQLLQEDHRYLFTLIQKFHLERGQVYPALTQRVNIIVIVDEAHRSQYDILALNMRNALPLAAFIAYTGTPLMAGEELRHMAENLNEEELAVFDLLIGKPPLKMTKKERKQVKGAARKLLEVLKAEKLTLDWRKRQQARASMRVTIEKILDQQLPDAYTPEVYQQKCEAVYQYVYESYFGAGRSIYSMPLAV